MKFSLVLATYDRKEELALFLQSLVHQTIGRDAFEVIVVDQNDAIDLRPVLAPYEALFPVVHLRSAIKGLSLNRNIGLAHDRGEWVAFPDDDCEYYPDTLETVANLIHTEPVDVCMGRIRDRHLQKDIIRRWPSRVMSVSPGNFFRLTSSITVFARRSDVRFDERMGVGAYFGGSEDADYLWQLMEQGRVLKYFPQIEVNHPDQSSSQVPQEKLNSYMRGFGALIRKHPSWAAIKLLTLALGYYSAQCLLALLRLDFPAFKRRWVANGHCVRGLMSYGR